MAECCGGSNILIYSCSGAADLGEASDKTARKLRDLGLGKMTCLAGIGAGLSGYVESARGSDKNIVIDGCQVACGKKAMDKIGAKCTPYILTEMGYIKGKTPVTEQLIMEISDAVMNAELKGVAPGKPKQGGGSCGCGGKC